MELTLDPEIPQRYIAKNGKTYFNKGNTYWKRVKQTDELKARKREILREIRAKVPPMSYSHVRSRAVVAIKDNELCFRFKSITDATLKTGINCISRSCRTNVKAGGYKWFYEEDNHWANLVNQK